MAGGWVFSFYALWVGGKFRKFERGGGISCGVRLYQAVSTVFARGFECRYVLGTVEAVYARLPDLFCCVIAVVGNLTWLF